MFYYHSFLMCPSNIIILYIILHFLVIRVGVMLLAAFYIAGGNWESVYIHGKQFTGIPKKCLLLLLVCFFPDFHFFFSAIFTFGLFSCDVFETVLFLSSKCCLFSRIGSVFFTAVLFFFFNVFFSNFSWVYKCHLSCGRFGRRFHGHITSGLSNICSYLSLQFGIRVVNIRGESDMI